MVKRNGKFEEVSWDEAIGFIADRLLSIKNEHGADAIAQEIATGKGLDLETARNAVQHCLATGGDYEVGSEEQALLFESMAMITSDLALETVLEAVARQTLSNALSSSFSSRSRP